MENVIKIFFDKVAPSWDERETLSIEYKEKLIDELDIHEYDDILDVACGTGVVTNLLHEHSKSPVTAIDISSNMIEIAKEKYKEYKDDYIFIADDFLTHKFDKKFDYIIIYNAYPHFKDPEALKLKIKDSLKENGRFAIMHSMSLKKLNEHHKNVDSSIYREFLSFEEEAKRYEDYFNIEKIVDSDHLLLIGRLK